MASRPLIVRIRNWLGDAVMGLPALHLIESHGYSLRIVARGGWAPALLGGYDWPVHVQPARLREKVGQLRDLRAACRSVDPAFDRRENALVLAESFSSAAEMRLAGLRAVGYAKEGRSPLLARAEPITYGGHALISYWNLACRFLQIAPTAPPPRIGFKLAPDKLADASKLLLAHGVSGDYLLVCPFAAGLTLKKLGKKWPHFAEFVSLASRRLDMPLVVYPGPGEHAQARELYAAANMIEGADAGVYAALLHGARLVVANDTGPAHMAAALGTDLLSVLGPTLAHQFAPWGPQVTVLQHPPVDGTAVWPSAEEVLAACRLKLDARAAT